MNEQIQDDSARILAPPRWFVYFHYRMMRWRTTRYEPHPDSPFCVNKPYCPSSPYWLSRAEAQAQANRLNALEHR